MNTSMPLKGDHVINVRISYELKSRIQAVAENEHRSIAEVCRVLLLTALPIFEGLDKARAGALRLWQEPSSPGRPLLDETTGLD